MMNKEQTIELLRNEVKTNTLVNGVFHLLAMRIRPRHTLTVSAIYQKMLGEGFKYKKQDYVEVITLLAKGGFGQIATNSRGRTIGLININCTLQSIALAALGNTNVFKPYVRKPLRSNVALKQNPRVLKTLAKPPVAKLSVKLVLTVNGKPIDVVIPTNLTTEELAGIICAINS